MRKALATTALAVGLALGGAPLITAPAYATTLAGDGIVAQEAETDVDEPLSQDGDDDTGKYGLIGLTGLFGLFGYKKYRDRRDVRHQPNRPSGNTGDSPHA